MRVLTWWAFLGSWILTGCGAVGPWVGTATTAPHASTSAGPRFEDAQRAYTASLRLGRHRAATDFVEPSLRPRFAALAPRLREMRFDDAWVETMEIDGASTRASATVVLRGYWLASPYLRDLRAVQRWRRSPHDLEWYVTPDFDALQSPPWASSRRAPPVGAGADGTR